MTPAATPPPLDIGRGDAASWAANPAQPRPSIMRPLRVVGCVEASVPRLFMPS